MTNPLVCRELGKAYSQSALEFLMAKAGDSAIELSDLMEFHASAISWLTASGFCLVLEKAGTDEAYRFLSLVMAGTSACVRLKDAPFMLKMSAELMPIEEEEKPEEAKPEEAKEGTSDPTSCACHLGNTEDCLICPKMLKIEYQGLVGYLLSYLYEMGARSAAIEKFCVPCGAKHADLVISEIVKEGISKGPEPEPLKQQAVAIALQTVQAFGLSEAPLTVQALRDRQGS